MQDLYIHPKEFMIYPAYLVRPDLNPNCPTEGQNVTVRVFGLRHFTHSEAIFRCALLHAACRILCFAVLVQ